MSKLLPSLRRHAVNLLPRDPFEKSLAGKALLWALAIGKWTVIVTELIVVAAFLMRFSLDRRLTDLRKAMKQETVILASYAETEKRFLEVQKRLAFIQPVIAKNEAKIQALSTLASLAPPDLWLETLRISDTSISLEAKALSIGSFGSFIQGLERHGMFSRISVSDLTADVDRGGALEFNLTLEYGGQK